MVKLRLKRMGKKGAPFYRIVAADSRSPRDGRFIEQIGTYNPTKAEEKVTLDKELAKKWLSNGAQPTDTVRSILSHEGVLKEMHEAKIMIDLEKTLLDICLPLVDDQKALSVKTMATTNENEILLYVYANSEDVARLIGRKGIMASSIRQMMSIAARDVHKRISVKFEAY